MNLTVNRIKQVKNSPEVRDARKGLAHARFEGAAVIDFTNKAAADILAKHQFTGMYGVGIVIEPELAYLLDAADFATYHAELVAAQTAEGFFPNKPGNCPALEAQSAIRAAENVAIGVMLDLISAGGEKGHTVHGDLRKRTLQLFEDLLKLPGA